MTKKETKENLDIVVTFRLSQTEYAPYEKLIEDSGFAKSKVMREVFIAKSDQAVLPQQQSKDSKKVLFFANKTSNNINQLARKLNSDHKKGIVNSQTYTKLLNNLINIERSFFSAIEKC